MGLGTISAPARLKERPVATEAKKAFDVNIKRASYFLDIHEETQLGVGAPSRARRELPRGAVVFAVGALDAYLSDVSAEVMVTRLQSDPAGGDLRDLLRQVQKEVPTLSLEVALLPTREERITHIHDAILEHFRTNVSNHGSKAVSAAVLRMERRPTDFWADIERTHEDAPGELDHWTDVRHEIVHLGKKSRVRRPHARDFIDLVKDIAGTLDSYAVAACS
jgi:hypothetical protein